jgi:TPR repeat protein
MCFYGIGLAFGYLGEKNLKEAMKYYQQSAYLGNSDGMYCYGIGLEKGLQ